MSGVSAAFVAVPHTKRGDSGRWRCLRFPGAGSEGQRDPVRRQTTAGRPLSRSIAVMAIAIEPQSVLIAATVRRSSALACKCVARIDAAGRAGAGCSRPALGHGGEGAVTGMAPLFSLQAVSALRSRGAAAGEGRDRDRESQGNEGKPHDGPPRMKVQPQRQSKAHGVRWFLLLRRFCATELTSLIAAGSGTHSPVHSGARNSIPARWRGHLSHP